MLGRRFCLRALNFIGCIVKAIRHNFDTKDGAYYDQVIKKLETDQRKLKNHLEKNKFHFGIEIAIINIMIEIFMSQNLK